MPGRCPGTLPALPRTPGWGRRGLRGGLIGRSRSVGTNSSHPPLRLSLSSLSTARLVMRRASVGGQISALCATAGSATSLSERCSRKRRSASHCTSASARPQAARASREAVEAAQRLGAQLTAFFTSATIRSSSAGVSSLSAKAVGHMLPSSRFAASWNPNVEYLVLNLCPLWKKQTTFPSLVYAGIPYQVLGQRAGAAAVIIAWSRSAMARSGCGISAIFARTALSPAALFLVIRASAFSSRARSFIAARSSALNPLDFLLVAAPFVDFSARPFSVAFVLAIENLLSVLKQPENVAIRVADGGHQAAATDVAHGLGNGRSHRGRLGELRLDVRHVPESDRRGHPLRPPARHQPGALARHVEADVVVRVVLRRHAEQSRIHCRRRRQIGHGTQHGFDPLGGRAGHGHFRSSLSSSGHIPRNAR